MRSVNEYGMEYDWDGIWYGNWGINEIRAVDLKYVFGIVSGLATRVGMTGGGYVR